MNDFFTRITAFLFSLITAATGNFFGLYNPVEPTPLSGRDYTDTSSDVQPDESKYLSITVLGEGRDIYAPEEGAGAGYRYGPTIFTNADGSLDVWFAAPGAKEEWDWITYRHSPDGGKSWTDEKKVLCPTPGSKDFYSVCDPGVIKIGEYYYIGYTSTVNSGGIDNNVFVARGKAPDGPFEKWNGSGWGGNPEPVIDFSGSPENWGAGEPSFVLRGDVLYMYYTWKDSDSNGNPINETRVATANAKDENWPGNLSFYRGSAITYADYSCDSADVKYIEDYGKFVAVSTSARMGENSFLSVYESDNGLRFEKVNDLKSYICYYCHNAGISSRSNGHIRLDDKQHFIAYAYGPKWGFWGTRMQEISFSLTDSPDFSDAKNENLKVDVAPVNSGIFRKYLGITTSPHVYSRKLSDGSFGVTLYKTDISLFTSRIYGSVSFSNYDEKIIKICGKRIYPLTAGTTFVTAEWRDMSVTFLVVIDDDSAN